MKKWIACLSAVLLMLTMLPMTALAEDAFEIFGGVDSIRTPIFGYVSFESNADDIGATDVTWETDNAEVLYLTDGYAEARQAGTATLTATTAEGYSDSVTVTVYSSMAWGGLGTKTVYLNPQYPGRTFELTVSKDGKYRFTSDSDADPYFDLLDADGMYLTGGDDDNGTLNFDTTQWLSEGTYYVYLKVYGHAVATVDLTIEEVAAEEEDDAVIAFESETLELYMGDVTTPSYIFNPTETGDEVTMTVSDDAVLYLDGETIGALAPGTATVTITTTSGESDTLSVTVGEPRMLEPDTLLTTDITEDIDSRALWFVPETSGVYVFRSMNETGDPYAALVDGEGNLIFENDDDDCSLNFRMEIDCEAGEAYALYATTYSGAATYDVIVTTPVAATTLELGMFDGEYASQSGDTYYVMAGKRIGFSYAFGDAYGAIVEDVWLETTDSDVLSIVEFGADPIAPGTVQVTVHADSGLTDTITVVVIEPVMGDVTLDGQANMMDVMALYNINRGKGSTITANGKAMAEVTGDNIVNMMDVMAMYNTLSGN